MSGWIEENSWWRAEDGPDGTTAVISPSPVATATWSPCKGLPAEVPRSCLVCPSLELMVSLVCLDALICPHYLLV